MGPPPARKVVVHAPVQSHESLDEGFQVLVDDRPHPALSLILLAGPSTAALLSARTRAPGRTPTRTQGYIVHHHATPLLISVRHLSNSVADQVTDRIGMVPSATSVTKRSKLTDYIGKNREKKQRTNYQNPQSI